MMYDYRPDGVSPIWLKQVATALSSRYNVSLREGRTWSMNIEDRVMTYKAEHLLALDRDTCLGILLHELGHLHFTSNAWTGTSKLYKAMPNITFNAVNHYEDVRVNEKMSQSYMGSRDLIEAMNELLAGDGVKKMVSMNNEILQNKRVRTNFEMPEWYEIFYISMCKLLGDNLFPQITPDMYYDSKKMTIVNEIVREADTRKLAVMKTTDDIYKFVEQIVFPKIQDYLPMPIPDGGQGDGRGKENTEETEEKSDAPAPEGTEQSEDEKSDESENQNTEEEKKPEEGNGEESKKPEEKKPEEGAKRGGQGVGGDSWKREIEDKVKNAIRRGRVNPDEQHRTEPFDRYGDTRRNNMIVETCNVDNHFERSRNLQRQFRNKFEVIFRDNQYAREVVGQKNGRLNKRVLYKFPLGQSRLFKKKIEVSKKSYAVAFALDLSGSMSREQVSGSFRAMLAFTSTLEAMKISHAVGFFSSGTEIGKSFEKKMVNRHMSMKASSVNNGGTEPRGLLKFLFGQDLVAQKVKERIAIVLTDGLWSYSGYEELERLRKSNPTMHIYIVPLMLHPAQQIELVNKIGKNAIVLQADSPEEIMDRYIQIAKKHLL